jgi:hypothetical protein
MENVDAGILELLELGRLKSVRLAPPDRQLLVVQSQQTEHVDDERLPNQINRLD